MVRVSDDHLVVCAVVSQVCSVVRAVVCAVGTPDDHGAMLVEQRARTVSADGRLGRG